VRSGFWGSWMGLKIRFRPSHAPTHAHLVGDNVVTVLSVSTLGDIDHLFVFQKAKIKCGLASCQRASHWLHKGTILAGELTR
jgi:hypothetical protein